MKVDDSSNVTAPAAPDTRLSTNLQVGRQTRDDGFAARLVSGASTVGGVVAQGVNTMANFVPGGSIVSAAVSSLTTLAGSGGGGGGAAAPYTSAMVSGVNVPTIDTSVGGTGGSVPGTGGGVGVGIPGGTGTQLPDFAAGNTGNVGQEYNGLIQGMYDKQKSLLNLQVTLQHENIVFTTISNVLKTRHDTAKNAVGNVR